MTKRLSQSAARMVDTLAADAYAKTYAAGAERADVLNLIAIALGEQASRVRTAKIEEEAPTKEDA